MTLKNRYLLKKVKHEFPLSREEIGIVVDTLPEWAAQLIAMDDNEKAKAEKEPEDDHPRL